MELIKYRDAGMATYTYFWVNDKQKMVSPFFETEEKAKAWLEQQDWDNWKPIRDIV